MSRRDESCIGMWERYFNVTSLAQALELLHEHREHARVIAGGTDILLELERGARKGVEILIDISRVPGLNEISLRGGDVRLGALTTHNQVVVNPITKSRALPLAQACWEVGAPQIRNRATVAGNLITASPANDTITPLMALEASVTLASVEGERTVHLREFYTGLRRTVMRPDELLTAITFPALGTDERGVFIKLGLRRAQAIAVINVAVVLSFAGDAIQSARITLGSVAPTIIHAPTAEAYLQGRRLSEDVIVEAARLAAATPAPIDDIRATAEYRTEMVRVLVARALRRLAAGEEAQGYPDDPAQLWGVHEGHGALASSSEHTISQPIVTVINGEARTVATGQHKSLLRFLREDCGMPGTKEGCAEGECGACTVFLDGAAVMACMVPAPRVHGAEVVTVEGLAEEGNLHPIQSAFVECGAVQCGYCTPGFIMAGAKLLEEHPHPTDPQIQQSISGNLCRCTGYYKIIDAFRRASQS